MKILVVGHSPSAGKKKVSATFKRLNAWMDACGIGIYSFTNVSADHVETLRQAQVDQNLINIVHGYSAVLSLGGEVARLLEKLNVAYYPLPHPSPRNRKFNDKSFERRVISDLQRHLNGV